MKNNHTRMKIINFFLISVSTFIILEFYQHDTFTIFSKAIITIALIVINCTYNYRNGLKDGVEMGEEHGKHMEKLREESFNKIVDMVAKEKINDKAVD